MEQTYLQLGDIRLKSEKVAEFCAFGVLPGMSMDRLQDEWVWLESSHGSDSKSSGGRWRVLLVETLHCLAEGFIGTLVSQSPAFSARATMPTAPNIQFKRHQDLVMLSIGDDELVGQAPFLSSIETIVATLSKQINRALEEGRLVTTCQTNLPLVIGGTVMIPVPAFPPQ